MFNNRAIYGYIIGKQEKIFHNFEKKRVYQIDNPKYVPYNAHIKILFAR